MQVRPYLFFDGRCEEAIEFYRAALGAKLEMLMRFKDSPEQQPGSYPPGAENKVMHASFRIGDTTLQASDGRCEQHASFRGFSDNSLTQVAHLAENRSSRRALLIRHEHDGEHKGATDEQRTSPGRHEKRWLHLHVRREAPEVGHFRPAVRRLGDLPHEGSPVDPNRIYASQTSGWFGQIIQRSDDGGKTWHQPGTPRPKRRPEGPAHDRASRQPAQRPRACPRVRATSSSTTSRLKPADRSRRTSFTMERKIPGTSNECGTWSHRSTDPNTVYAGVEDAAMFKTDRRRQELERARRPAAMAPWR